MSARRRRRRERARRHQVATPPTFSARAVEFREAREVERLAYSRRQAAEALGVSISTVDRRVVPAIDSVKTPWGQRLIPVAELERFLRAHLERGRRPATIRRPAPGVRLRSRSRSSTAYGSSTHAAEALARSLAA